MHSSASQRTATNGLPIGAALLAALAASSCCIGPVVLAALGLGGAGLFAGTAAYRPLMLGVTALFLGVGFYLSYRKPGVVRGDACGCDAPKVGKMPRMFLWFATVIAIVVAAAPPLMAKLSIPPSRLVSPSSAAAIAVIEVEGIDCAACAAPIRRALAVAGGFDDLKLDVPTKKVTVIYEPGAGRPDVYLKAIDDLGYEAVLASPPEGQKATR